MTQKSPPSSHRWAKTMRSYLLMLTVTCVSVTVFCLSFCMTALRQFTVETIPWMKNELIRRYRHQRLYWSDFQLQLHQLLAQCSLPVRILIQPPIRLWSWSISLGTRLLQFYASLAMFLVQTPYIFLQRLQPLQTRLSELLYAYLAMLVVCGMVITRFAAVTLYQLWSMATTPVQQHQPQPEFRTQSPPRYAPSPSFEERLADFSSPLVSPMGTMKHRRDSGSSYAEHYKRMRRSNAASPERRQSSPARQRPSVKEVFSSREE